LCSGASPGTICVGGFMGETVDIIKVRILDGHVSSTQFGSPDTSSGIEGSTTPVGQYWCVRNIGVPHSSSTGMPFTVVAWSGSGGSWSAAAAAAFYGGRLESDRLLFLPGVFWRGRDTWVCECRCRSGVSGNGGTRCGGSRRPPRRAASGEEH